MLDYTRADRCRRGVFTQTWPTSADGRFAFLKIPPVPVRVTVRYRDQPAVVVGPIAIKAREVASVNAVVKNAAEAGSCSVSVGEEEPAKAKRKPATLAEALALLEHRPEWADRPDLDFPKHPAEKYLKGMTIVLDPGHGGGRRRSSDGNREADMNLRVGKLLEKLLRDAGVNVQMTRDGDDGLPATWWGGDRQRILSSTISVYVDDQTMDIDYDPAEKKLVAKLGGFEVPETRIAVLRIHFANLFKHHNWPQRFAIRFDETGNQVHCFPIAARRYQPPKN